MGEIDKGDIYADAFVKFLKKGRIPDGRIGAVTGNSMKVERYDPKVIQQITDERRAISSRRLRLGLRRAS